MPDNTTVIRVEFEVPELHALRNAASMWLEATSVLYGEIEDEGVLPLDAAIMKAELALRLAGEEL